MKALLGPIAVGITFFAISNAIWWTNESASGVAGVGGFLQGVMLCSSPLFWAQVFVERPRQFADWYVGLIVTIPFFAYGAFCGRSMNGGGLAYVLRTVMLRFAATLLIVLFVGTVLGLLVASAN